MERNANDRVIERIKYVKILSEPEGVRLVYRGIIIKWGGEEILLITK